MKTVKCGTTRRHVWLGTVLAAFLVICGAIDTGAVLLTTVDDGEVQGNLCVGNGGCADGEAYGDAVIKIKDVNIRLLFEDASVGPGLASNDWQITINDSSGGTVERFSIEDITGATTPFTILAGAPD
jgi:hypothetical protein